VSPGVTCPGSNPCDGSPARGTSAGSVLESSEAGVTEGASEEEDEARAGRQH